MSKEWNRRDFIVKPIVWAGAAGVLSKTSLSFAEPANSAPLLQRTLGRTGLTLPIVSMGVMNADIPGLIRRSYELGIRHFDTAAVYQNGRNEEMVGAVVKEMGIRDKIIVSTKQGTRASFQNTAEFKKRMSTSFITMESTPPTMPRPKARSKHCRHSRNKERPVSSASQRTTRFRFSTPLFH